MESHDRRSSNAPWERTRAAHALRLVCSVLCGALALAASVARGAENGEGRPVDGIMDNSFLVEEAYNQEAGVVQHILTGSYYVNREAGPDDQLWAINFTQEWPLLSQKHQLSFTVPYLFLETDNRSTDGLGDVLLNYRFQAFFDPDHWRAFAPRASLVLPTGRSKLGFSDETVGGQFNLPFSAAWGDRWFTHLNAGLTYLPEALSAGERDALNYNLGASVIYAATAELHFLIEWTGNWFEVPRDSGGLQHEFLSVLSPGVRKAFNFANDSQLVLGLAVPVGLTRSTPEVGVFLYLSFEHFFARKE